MKRIITKTTLLVVFFSLFLFSAKFHQSQSVLPTNIKDQLSSAQLSYFARLGAGNTVNNTNILINTDAGTAPSISTANLFVGDTISIGNSGVGFTGSTSYVVKDVPSTNTISLSSGIGSSNIFTGAYIVATRSAVHTIYLTPQSNVTGGKWQVLIKATNTSGETFNDGMPDQNGFDLGTLTSTDILCPWGATAGLGSTSVSGSLYHQITCSLGAGATNTINVGSTITIGVGTSMLINPSASSGHTVGSGDVYTFYIRHLDASGIIIDSDTAQGKIAVVESVRVTATVDPTITFSIGTSGVTSVGTTVCGAPLGANAASTTASSVGFGSLTLGSLNNLAQFIQCTTNAANGYVIQTFESGRLTMIGSATTLPDTTCPSNACTPTSAAAWTTYTTSGFGYSLQVGTTSAGADALGIGATNLSKPFGAGYANAQTIMSRSNTPSGTDSVYVCYRIAVSNYQPAGTYQNQINYIATATF